MTQKQLLELLMADYPDRGEAYFRTMANVALSEFSEQTRLFVGHAEIVTVEGQIAYELPDDLIEVERVMATRGEQVVTMQAATPETATLYAGMEIYVLAAQREIQFGYMGQEGVLTPVAAGRKMQVFYVRQATPLSASAMDERLPLPGEFHGAVEARIRERLTAPVVEERSYWHAIWRDLIRRAKQRANTGVDGTRIYNIRVPVI
jgi:hypothetical protein